MFPITNIVENYWLIGQAPIITEGYVTPQEASLIFSGPQFLVALASGIVMAIAFQLLLTNFSIAIGISSLGEWDSDDDDTDTVGGTVKKVEAKVGIWALITATIALFIASFLAVKLSLIESTLLGGIIGVVIWSTYFSLIAWLGSSAAGSLIGSLLSTASSGVQGIIGTATGALGANAAKNQMVSTAEDITAAVRRELTSGINTDSIKNTVETSLGSVNLPNLNLNEIRGQFDRVLQDSNLKSLANSNLLQSVNRDTFINLISNRTDFSQQDINKVADQLEAAWTQAVGSQNPTQQVMDLIEKSTPEQLNSEDLGSQLEKQLAGVAATGGTGLLMQQALKYGLGAAVPAVMKNVHLSDLDIDKIKPQLQKLKEKTPEIDIDKISQQLQNLKEQATQKISQASANNNPIKEDVEGYILNSFPWHFNRLTLKDEFKEAIYDTDADPKQVKQRLEEIDQDYLTDLLKQREDLSEARVKEIVGQMEEVRNEVLQTVNEATSQNLRSQIEDYLSSTSKDELNPEAVKRDFSQLLEDSEASFEELSDRLSNFDRNNLVEVLSKRDDISQEEADNIVNQLEGTRDEVLNKAQELQQQAENKTNELREKVENYLLKTNKDELNPEGIKREFKTLIDDPEVGAKQLRKRLSQFDRDTLVQLLSQRDDLSEEEINKNIDQLLSVRNNVLQAPRKVAGKAKQQYEKTVQSISEYLRNTEKEELNPEGIKRDLQKLLDDPKTGASAIGDRLSQIDRETLVKLLSQRDDLSEEKINQVIDDVQDSISDIVKAPRRLAKRTGEKARSFQSQIEEYLRNTDKEELNPEEIKHDLQKLLEDPNTGASAIQQRFSQVDRETLVKLLSQRDDLSEEKINQVIDDVQDSISDIVKAPRRLAKRTGEKVASFQSQIEEYLRNTDKEELNPEGIKRDLQKLLDDPKTGASAIGDRLSQMDRETLVKLLSQRDDLSEEKVNQVIDNVQNTINDIVKAPSRLAKRTNEQVANFQANIEEYLRNTDKEELNPEGIKRDLQLLLQDPRAGIAILGDRVSQFDRSTLVSVLSQREDISEEEANRIADQIESTRDSIVQQYQQVQQQVQSAVDGSLNKIRNYLNSLERPELNYEGIKQDFTKLFDDPQMGVEALRSRLSEFDRDSLIAVLSSRDDISQKDANRIVNQIESARDSVLERGERIQKETKKRLKAVKKQAKKQAKDAKGAAASAAWWLFGAALASLAASAVAGVLAVRSIYWW
ncbi:MFS transporter [Calothrix sp. CCY 0018]|uniref:MFS transporter n=1 Tax=Calothrix sp. CCY 0018 TaxID=3103864 RepID=UPI0039C674B2